MRTAAGQSGLHYRFVAGSRPRFHLTTGRLTLARSMLSSGGLSLLDVAAHTDFQTQQHFTDVFHRYTGMTPRIFRLAARGATRASEDYAAGSQKPDTSQARMKKKRQ
jgi:AraC family transcriptional regulator